MDIPTFKAMQSQSPAELADALRIARERLATLHIDLAAGKVKNVREIQSVRKHIAKILTLQNSRSAGARAQTA